MTLRELVDNAHAMSRSKGWYDGDDAVRNVPEMLALIHSEVSEALEAYRVYDMDPRTRPCCDLYEHGHRQGCQLVGKPEGFPSELADVIIRIGDLCGYLGIDLEAAVTEKMAYNATRTHRHGGKRA